MSIGESVSQRLARKERMRTAFPELEQADEGVIGKVDELRRAEGRPLTSLGQAAESAYMNSMARPSSFDYNPDQPDTAPNVLPWNPGGAYTPPDPYSTEALSEPAMPPPQSYYRGAARPGETLGRAFGGLTATAAPEGSNRFVQEALRPINYLPVGGGAAGLRVARGVAGGVLGRFAGDAAYSATEGLPEPVRMLGALGAGAVGAGVGIAGVSAAPRALRAAGEAAPGVAGGARRFALDDTGSLDFTPQVARRINALVKRAQAGEDIAADLATLPREQQMEVLGRSMGATTPAEQAAQAPWNRPAEPPTIPEALRNARIEENVGNAIGRGPGSRALTPELTRLSDAGVSVGDAVPPGMTRWLAPDGTAVGYDEVVGAGAGGTGWAHDDVAAIALGNPRGAAGSDNIAVLLRDGWIRRPWPNAYEAWERTPSTLSRLEDVINADVARAPRGQQSIAVDFTGDGVSYQIPIVDWGGSLQRAIRDARAQGRETVQEVLQVPRGVRARDPMTRDELMQRARERATPEPDPFARFDRQNASMEANRGLDPEDIARRGRQQPPNDAGFTTVGNMLRPAVTNTLGAGAGGVAGNAATPEGATREERMRNIALGAGAGLGVAAGARGLADDLAARRRAPPAADAQPSLPGMPPIKKDGRPAYIHDLVADALDLSTGGLRAAFDLSGLRQMAPALAGHPIRGARAIKQELKAVFGGGGKSGEANYVANEARIDAQPWAARREAAAPDWRRTMDAGVGQLDSPRQPTFLLRAANRLGYRASNRGFVSLLNTMDDELFGMMVQQDGRALNAIPDDVVKQYSTLANISTGRGPLPKGFKNEIGGARLFWAPALLSSRVMLPVEVLRPSVNNVVRKEAARQLVAFVSVNLAALKTGEALGVWTVGRDPTNSDIGQAKIGNQTIDPWAGYRPIVNLIARMMTGQVGTADGGRMDKRREQILVDFLRSKTAPGASTAWNLAAGKDVVGNDFGWKDVPGDLLAPLFMDDLQEAVTNGHGLGEVETDPAAAAKRGGIGLLSGIGAGVTTRTPDLPAQGYGSMSGEEQLGAVKAEGWRMLQQEEKAPPEAKSARDFNAWYYGEIDKLIAENTSEMQKRRDAALARGDQGSADDAVADLARRAKKAVDASPTTKAYERARSMLEEQWVKDNAQLTLSLRAKYDDGDKDFKDAHKDWYFSEKQLDLARKTIAAVPKKQGTRIERDPATGRVAAVIDTYSDGSEQRKPVQRDERGRLVGVA